MLVLLINHAQPAFPCVSTHEGEKSRGRQPVFPEEGGGKARGASLVAKLPRISFVLNNLARFEVSAGRSMLAARTSAPVSGETRGGRPRSRGPIGSYFIHLPAYSRPYIISLTEEQMTRSR